MLRIPAEYGRHGLGGGGAEMAVQGLRGGPVALLRPLQCLGAVAGGQLVERDGGTCGGREDGLRGRHLRDQLGDGCGVRVFEPVSLSQHRPGVGDELALRRIELIQAGVQ
ncbi:hypothetical protein [Nocardia niwae]